MGDDVDTQPIKIIRIQSRIVIGGPSLQTILLTKYFNKDGFKSLLVGGGEDTDEKSMRRILNREQLPYLIVHNMGRSVSPLADIKALWKLYRLLRKEKPQIIHTHTAKAGALGRLAAFMARVPIIVHTFHGHVFHSYFPVWKSRLFIWVERVLAKLSDAIIVISDSQYDDIAYKYKITNTLKIKKIPLGFNWNTFDAKQRCVDLRDQFLINPEKKIIAIIGRIVPIKDIALFIKVALQLNSLAPDRFHFLIIGDGELRERMEGQVEINKMTESITFTGWLELSAPVYRQIDLVLLTSLNEGTPVTIIEALACGVPCVCSDVGGVKDIMGLYRRENLFTTRDASIIAQLVLKAVSSNEKPDKRIQTKIRAFYSAERLTHDLETLYNRILTTSLPK